MKFSELRNTYGVGSVVVAGWNGNEFEVVLGDYEFYWTALANDSYTTTLSYDQFGLSDAFTVLDVINVSKPPTFSPGDVFLVDAQTDWDDDVEITFINDEKCIVRCLCGDGTCEAEYLEVDEQIVSAYVRRATDWFEAEAKPSVDNCTNSTCPISYAGITHNAPCTHANQLSALRF